MLNKFDRFFDILLIFACTIGGAAITYFLAGIMITAIMLTLGITSEYLIYIVGIPFGCIGGIFAFVVSATLVKLIDELSTLFGKCFASIYS